MESRAHDGGIAGDNTTIVTASGTVRRDDCDYCDGGDALVRVAEERIARIPGPLTPVQREGYVTGAPD